MTLDEIFNSTGKINGKKLCVFRSTEEYLHILKETEKHKPASDIESIFLYKNNIDPKRCGCGSRLKFTNFKKGYQATFCSPKCSNSSTSLKNKRKATMIEKYGTDNALKNKRSREKRKATMIEKYGTEHALQNVTLKKKAKESFQKTATIKTQNSHIKKLTDVDWLNEEYKNKSQQIISREIGCSQSTVGLYLNKHNISTNNHRLHSSLEKNICSFLTGKGIIDILASSRSIIPPKELDIYIKDKSIAIEMNGLFWHSIKSIEDDTKENQRYHLNKTELCEEKGVQLLHIMDTEWNDKRTQVESLILSKLGLNERLYARKCIIEDITSKEGRDFVDRNHMQGSVIGGTYKGLKYDGELVAIMQISKSRFDKNIDFELLRFCNKNYYNVIGGFSRLLKAFSLSGSLVSYANRRWSNGKVYEKNGFSLIRNTPPNYWYWKDYGVLESRHKFQKFKLRQFPSFDDKKTESQIMFEEGYNKFYDSGNLVYIKNF